MLDEQARLRHDAISSKRGAVEEGRRPPMTTVGWHLLLELYDCDAEVLDDVHRIRDTMRAVVDAVGASVVGETYHHFRPSGVTGVIAIAESHLSIHTWPESRYASADIYTCGQLNPMPGVELLARSLDAQSWMLESIFRGLPADLRNHQLVVDRRGRAITEMDASRHTEHQQALGGRR